MIKLAAIAFTFVLLVFNAAPVFAQSQSVPELYLPLPEPPQLFRLTSPGGIFFEIVRSIREILIPPSQCPVDPPEGKHQPEPECDLEIVDTSCPSPEYEVEAECEPACAPGEEPEGDSGSENGTVNFGFSLNSCMEVEVNPGCCTEITSCNSAPVSGSASAQSGSGAQGQAVPTTTCEVVDGNTLRICRTAVQGVQSPGNTINWSASWEKLDDCSAGGGGGGDDGGTAFQPGQLGVSPLAQAGGFAGAFLAAQGQQPGQQAQAAIQPAGFAGQQVAGGVAPGQLSQQPAEPGSSGSGNNCQITSQASPKKAIGGFRGSVRAYLNIDEMGAQAVTYELQNNKGEFCDRVIAHAPDCSTASRPRSCRVTTASLPGGTVSTSYDQTISTETEGFSATNVTCALVSGSVPSGTTLSNSQPQNCQINGTPNTEETVSPQIRATISGGIGPAVQCVSPVYSITIST